MMTFEEFIKKAKETHPNENLDYSKSVFVNSYTKICIIDHDINPDTGKEYGEYWQRPKHHLLGQSHPKKRTKKIRQKSKKSTEDFIKEAKEVHKDENLDYSKVVYINNHTKVCIIDHDINPKTGQEYGEYWMIPKNHLKGEKHPKKGKILAGIKKRNTTEDFIRKAKEIHKDENLDYSKTNYINKSTKVCIIDHNIDTITKKEYGEFWITPSAYLQGKLHQLRGIRKRTSSTEKFINIARKVHKDENLDYSKVVYINNHTPVCIIDHNINPMTNKEYGEFWQTPQNHLRYNGSAIQSATRKKTTEDFIKEAKKIHKEENLDYSKVDYVNNKTPVCIIDHDINPKTGQEYGEFWQRPECHLRGNTNSIKSNFKRSLTQRNTTEDVINRMKEKHPEGYFDFSKFIYNGMGIKSEIICHKLDAKGIEHGTFLTTPYNFILSKCGCPKCANSSTSKKEIKLYEFIQNIINDDIIQHDKDILNGKELDIYIPSKNLAIEFDGLYWHSELFVKIDYHLQKTNTCYKKGIRLIHIFEDEWQCRNRIVKDKIKEILCINTDKPCIGARKCFIKEIDKNTSSEFMNKFHIQGKARASYHFGAYYNNELVAVMTFIKRKEMEYELNRFATNINYRLPGIASKILKHFIKKIKPLIITSFADLRWIDKNENLYEKIGFIKESIVKPTYWYVYHGDEIKRYHKFNFRKQILHKKYGFPLSMTEKEMTEALGYYRIWDCGLIKYKMLCNNT